MAKQPSGIVHDEEMGLPAEQVPLLSKSTQELDDTLAYFDKPKPCSAAREDIPDLGGSDIVQFSAPICFADETEGVLKVDIIRLGSMKGRMAVDFATQDATAKSNEQYGSVWGQLVFEDEESVKTINIPILEDNDWTPTCEFKVCLTNAQNCHLGLYLYECRVKIINSDKFPTDRYAETIEKGEEAIYELDDWGLFREYCKLNFDSAGIKMKTAFVLCFDQLNNILIFGNLWVGVYIVDTLFARGGSTSALLVSNRYHTALLIGLWFVVPLVVLHAWDTLKTWLDIKGASRAFLQKSMLRTYMDYTMESRLRVSPAELDMAIDDSAKECGRAYEATLRIVAIIGKIITVAFFVFLYQPEPFAVYAVFILPMVLLIFTLLRVRVAQRAQKIEEDKMLVVVKLTNEVHQKIRLIADYAKRPLMGEIVSKAVDEHCEASVPLCMIELNTEFTTKFLSGLAICLFIALKAPEVLDGTMSLGIFLATIQVFGSHLAEAIMELNVQLMVIIRAFVALKEFTTFLNLPLELPALKSINRYRRQETATNRAKLLEGKEHGAFMSDQIPIAMTDLSFEYETAAEASGLSPRHASVLKDVNISVAQGQMVAVMGPHSSGKSTFLSLLSNILMPNSGHIYVPSHLRVLHVARDPMFLQASLLHNLALGVPESMIDVNRMKKILQMLGLGDLIGALERDFRESIDVDTVANTSRSAAGQHLNIKDFKTSGWERSLNHSRRAKLHIARALIANPEVMVLQRPFQAFEEESASDLIDILRKHVQERGLCMDEDGRASRRPRSVFFCTESTAQAVQADTIWQMHPENKTIVNTTPQALLDASTPRTGSAVQQYFDHAADWQSRPTPRMRGTPRAKQDASTFGSRSSDIYGSRDNAISE